MVVGSGLLESGSGVVFGTSISRSFTLTLILSGAGGAGLLSVIMAALDIDIQLSTLAAISISEAGSTPCVEVRRRGSSAAPLAINSSLNLPAKVWTGQAQASPKAQIVRP